MYFYLVPCVPILTVLTAIETKEVVRCDPGPLAVHTLIAVAPAHITARFTTTRTGRALRLACRTVG